MLANMSPDNMTDNTTSSRASGRALSESRVRERLDPALRRERILDAAHVAFAENPYPEVTISSVGRAAASSPALIYRYFEGKEALYVEVLKESFARLRGAQEAAMGRLPAGVSKRDRIREALRVYLDNVGAGSGGWLLSHQVAAGEPAQALRLRAEVREAYVEGLAEVLGPNPSPRRSAALWGFLGFLEAASKRWAADGYPSDQQEVLVETALGALEGALGDWPA